MIETDFPTQEQFDRFLHFLDVFVSSLPKFGLAVLLLVAGVFLAKLIIVLVLRLSDFRRLVDRDMLFLELTPPAFVNKTPQATQMFFSDLHGFNTIRAIRDKVLQHKSAFAVEMVGMRDQGIRFIFCVPKDSRESFEHDIASFDTSIKVREVKSYLTKEQRLRARLVELRLKEDYYPLKEQQSHDQSDPVDYLLGTMANLKSDEIMAIQLVLSPTKVRNADKISNRLLHNKEHLDALGKKQRRSFGGMFLQGINSLLFSMMDTVSEVHHGPSNYSKQTRQSTTQHHQQVAQGFKPERQIGALENMLALQVSEKLNSDLYRANIRALVVADNPQASAVRVNDIRKSFNVYKTKYQAIVSRLNFPYRLRQKYRLFMFEHRLPGIFNKYASLLSSAEVASIYHFPNNEINYNADVAKSLSKTLPPPLSVRSRADKEGFDVVLGRNVYHGNATDIGLVADERERHMYVIGSTGSGKTTLMKYAIVQDILNGKGVAVVDPHGDLATWLLKYIPEERIKDVIYFHPKKISDPIGMNLLELPAGLEGDELLIAKDFVTEAIVSIFRKIFSEDATGGHRIENVLRNAIYTAFHIEGATLFTVRKLLHDEEYRKKIVPTLEDEFLKDFWIHEFGLAGNYQKYKSMDGVITKLGRFQLSAVTRRMMEQKESTISFDEIMNSGKILICNLAKGEIGEDTSAVIGTTILAKLQLAAYRRIDIEEEDRRPFHLYVDECQNFISPLFVQILSESRKYKLFLTMAEQSTSQQDRQLTENILDNAGTIVCFRTGNPADEELMLHQFNDHVEKSEISRLPKYNFYILIGAGDAPETFSGETVVLKDPGSKEVAKQVIESSRQRYTRKYVPPPKPKPKPKAEPKKPSGKRGKNAAGKSNKPKTNGKDHLKRYGKRTPKPKNKKQSNKGEKK